MVYVDDVVDFSDYTNVSFRMSSLDDPAVAPVVERVDPPPVIPDAGTPAVCSTYERWSDDEDLLVPVSLARVLEAAIFATLDSLVAELRLCCPRSSQVRRVVDDLMVAFDAFAVSQAESICVVGRVPCLPTI